MSDPAFAKLKRLKINKYRSIKPGTELRFADGINVLLGKNGSGKTTLLNLLAMVVSGNFYPIRREEFSLEFDLAYANHSATWSVRIWNKSERKPIHASRRDEGPAYKLDVEHHGEDSFHVTVQDSTAELKRRNTNPFTHKFRPSTHGPFNEDNVSALNDLETVPISPPLQFLKLPARVTRLDEARDWLNELLVPNEFVTTLGIPAIDINGNDGELYLTYPLREVPDDFHEEIQQEIRRGHDQPFITINLDSVASIRTIVESLGYASGSAIFERMSSNSPFPTYGPPRFHFTKNDGTMVRLEDLSFGEQRLFAYYYYLACSPQMLIADELSNGMHHEMVRGCIEAIGPRQAFLATQNPLLLDYLEFASLDAVRESFVLCSREPGEDREWMTMRQMSDDEGREFFGHYQAERSHVNEILRSLGLW